MLELSCLRSQSVVILAELGSWMMKQLHRKVRIRLSSLFKSDSKTAIQDRKDSSLKYCWESVIVKDERGRRQLFRRWRREEISKSGQVSNALQWFVTYLQKMLRMPLLSMLTVTYRIGQVIPKKIQFSSFSACNKIFVSPSALEPSRYCIPQPLNRNPVLSPHCSRSYSGMSQYLDTWLLIPVNWHIKTLHFSFQFTIAITPTWSDLMASRATTTSDRSRLSSSRVMPRNWLT